MITHTLTATYPRLRSDEHALFVRCRRCSTFYWCIYKAHRGLRNGLCQHCKHRRFPRAEHLPDTDRVIKRLGQWASQHYTPQPWESET